MNQLSISILLVASIGLAICVPLENLCAIETLFYYKNLTVNGFYRVPQNVTFPPIEYFLIPPKADCVPSQFHNIAHREEVLKAKEYYNQKLIEIYSENFINNDFLTRMSDWMDPHFYNLRDRLMDIKREEQQNNHMPKCIDEFLEKIERISGLGYSLWDFGQDQFVKEKWDPKLYPVYPPVASMLEKLEDVLRSVDTDEETQTMVFHSDFIEEIYQKRIVRGHFMKFAMNNPSKNFYDVKANGTLFYEILLPYNNKNYDPTEPCVLRKDLSLFFVVGK